ncbi:MAG: KEOPS complex subunit Pcc1 [Candidatus Thermoplasmatota archaeon]
MEIKCNMKLDFKDKEKAKKIYKSVEVDNYHFVESNKKKDRIFAEIKSSSLSSILHTLNDFLSCISVAEKILDKN